MASIPPASRLHSRLAGALGPILIVLALAPTAAAEQDPGAFVANLGTQGIQALGSDVSPATRLARLRQLFREDFDIVGIGDFALGRYRNSATANEQQEYFNLYPDFTVRALSKRLDDYRGATFRVTGKRAFGQETVVNSEISRGDGGRVQLDWYLVNNGDHYRVTDVALAGVSLKMAERDQFASWITSNGGRFGALLAVLRQQLAQAW